ncbi:MAG: hypothetical protein L3J42_01440 [Hydrogenimonas sp.]|nr:hypothetical protein [Hydrogenimonas sp.]
MKKLFLALSAFTLLSWAIDYSERSTQELIASLHPGGKNIALILYELKKREASMTPEEKRAYKEKLKELKNVEK